MPLQRVNLTVDGRQLQTLYLALDELPGKLSRELFESLQAQVRTQTQIAEQADEANARRAATALALLEEHEKPPPEPLPAPPAPELQQLLGSLE